MSACHEIKVIWASCLFMTERKLSNTKLLLKLFFAQILYEQEFAQLNIILLVPGTANQSLDNVLKYEQRFYQYGSLIQYQFLWHIGDGCSINVLRDPSLSNVPLSALANFVNVDRLADLQVSDVSVSWMGVEYAHYWQPSHNWYDEPIT